MRGRPLTNDNPKGQASCKWSSGGARPLQMMIQRDRVAEVVREHGGPPPKSLDSDENF